MEPISNADRLVALLRRKLEERPKASSIKGAGVKAQGRNVMSTERLGVEALAAVEGVGDGPLRRALIENLLVDQLGPALTNDARFQQIVSRVTEAMEEDGEAATLLNQMVDHLRPS